MVMGTAGVRVDQGPLAERLGEGVGVRPAERLGPGPAGLDQLRAHPVVAELLGPFGQQVGPGRTELGARRLGEAVPGARGRRDSDSRSSRSRRAGVDLGVDVDLGGDRAVGPGPCPRAHGLGDQGLGGLALVGAGHIGGGHRDEMGGPRVRGARRVPVAGHRLDGRRHPRRPEQVDLDGGVEGGVEADRGRRVDDDVARREQAAVPSSSRPSPSWPTSPATATSRRRHPVVEAVAQLVRAGGRSSRCARSRGPVRCRAPTAGGWAGRAPRPRSRGPMRRRRSTRAVPRNPVAPVTRMRLPARAPVTTGTWSGSGDASPAAGPGPSSSPSRGRVAPRPRSLSTIW